MSTEVFDELLCHFVIKDLDPTQFELASKTLGCKRGGVDSSTKKAYLSMALEKKGDWDRAASFMSEHASSFPTIKISYAAFSKLTWGKFTLPDQVTRFASRYNCALEVQFATPPRKKS